MKKFSLIALILIIVSGFAFAGNTEIYLDEEYSAGLSYEKGADGFFAMFDAGANITGGLKTKSESIDSSISLDTDVYLFRDKVYGTSSELEAMVLLSPSADFMYRYGIFSGYVDGSYTLLAAKDFEASKKSSIVDYSHYFNVNGKSAFKLPLSKSFFDLYIDGDLNFVAFKTSETDFVRDRYFFGYGRFGFSYYIPSDKQASKYDMYYSADEDGFGSVAEKNNFDFVVDTNYRFGMSRDNGLDCFDHDFDIFINYNSIYGKNNVLSFVSNMHDYLAYTNEGLKGNTFSLEDSMEYYLKLNKGANAIDYFELSCGIDAGMNVDTMNNASTFNFGADADVYIPRIVPLEYFDNFSLALPTDIELDVDLSIKGKSVTTEFGYDVEVTPFYVELKKGLNILNMYANTVRVDVGYSDSYKVAAKTIKNTFRTLDVDLTFELDPVRGKNVGNAAVIGANYKHDFYDCTNSVTIAFGAEF